MPKRSSFCSAYSRHSPRTSHVVQMRFASRVEPPFSGKNASGSVCAHSASVCHAERIAVVGLERPAYAWYAEIDRIDEPIVGNAGTVL